MYENVSEIFRKGKEKEITRSIVFRWSSITKWKGRESENDDRMIYWNINKMIVLVGEEGLVYEVFLDGWAGGEC